MKKRGFALCVFAGVLLTLVPSCGLMPVADPDGTMTISLVDYHEGVPMYQGREEGPDQYWPYVSLVVQIYENSMNFTPTAVSAMDSAITNYYIRHGYGAELANLGQVEGLGSVTEKPTSGWAGTTAVEANHGYVVRFKHSYDVGAPGLPYYHYRMYVQDVLTDIYGGFAGATVKYQGPF